MRDDLFIIDREKVYEVTKNGKNREMGTPDHGPGAEMRSWAGVFRSLAKRYDEASFDEVPMIDHLQSDKE